ncbi:MAG: hypothetical protein ACFE0O_04670 [Opitutales bacterium]
MNTPSLPKLIAAASLTAGAALFLTACGGNSEKAKTAYGETTQAIEPETRPVDGLLLAEAPTDVRPIGAVLAEPKVGDTVTVTGRIGGTTEPFGEGYALFLMADESVMFCDEMADATHCPTPWDACCEDLDKLRANRALVQFVDEVGEVLTIDLQQAAGLSGLDKVIVTGTISQVGADGAVIINASGLYRPKAG